MATLRRVFVYSLVLLGAVLTASGLSGILRVTLETFGGTTLVSETDRGLALGLSLTIVGLPVWALAWRAAQRRSTESPIERRSLGRRLFLAAVRLIALSVAVPYAIQTGRWLIGVEPHGAQAMARTVVWGLLWAAHERVAAEVPVGSDHTQRIDRVEVYLAATAGFGLLAVSVGDLLARSLQAVYELLVGIEALVDGGIGPGLREATVVAVVGAAVWTWHWLRLARRDTGSTGWFVYLFLIGILSGTAAAVVSGSIVLHRIVAWALAATEETAATHFDVLPAALAGLLVGVATWGYHRAVLREAETGDGAGWSGPERVYRYLVTAAGMLTTAAGVATVLMVGLDLAVPGRQVIAAAEGVRDAVAVGLTLLLIGVPLWAWSWLRVQWQALAQPSERTTLPRRVLIFGAFGVAIITTVVASSVLLFEVFDALLAGELAGRLIEEQRGSIALLLTAGAVSIHYGLVLREDRARAPHGTPPGALRHVVVVAPRSGGLARILRERLDVTVTAWDRADLDDTPPVDAEATVAALRELGVRQAMAIVEQDGTSRVIPLGD